MKHSEQKYRVTSFDDVKTKLVDVGAKALPSSITYHYYAVQDSLDVSKLVVFPDKSEIHVLKEQDGNFTLTDRISVEDKESGLQWLKVHGHENTTLVTMDSTNYEYAGGIVGLYIINDKLHSVIFEFPSDQHNKMVDLFGMKDKEKIEQPYNKYLENNK